MPYREDERWEYRVVDYDLHVAPDGRHRDLEEQLASLGADGWELVSLTPRAIGNYWQVLCALKRPVRG